MHTFTPLCKANRSESFRILKRNFAFTLAEVLITLAIIGVVAAMVIPSLNNNIKNAQLVTALKKDYSTLSQATQMIVADNGGSIKGLCADDDNDCLRDLYGKYIKDIKTCNSGSSLGKCWHSSSGTKVAHYLNGNIVEWDSTYSAGVSINGGFIRFGNTSSSCNVDPWGHIMNKDACSTILIDVNGFTPPNIIGKDIFYFVLYETKILPYGSSSKDTAPCSYSNNGYGCAGKVLTEGAMNY